MGRQNVSPSLPPMTPVSAVLQSSAAALQTAIEHDRLLSGAVTLVASRDEILDVSAVGLADIAAGLSMAANTLFWVASQTKPITATALMMLMDEGRVNLDDPVERHLPEFTGQMVKVEEDGQHRLLRQPAHPPTVREMLSHTSGLPFGTPMEHPVRDALPLWAAVHGHAMMPLEFEPGSRYLYSNAGFSAAGRLIETVTGTPYEDFLRTRLFDPLGMTDTTFWPTVEQAARLARAYRPGKEGQALEEVPVDQLSYPVTDRARRFPFPGGGLFSTARDCAQFCRMILRDGELDGRRYVSVEAVREMTRRQTPAPVPEDYGLGWQRRAGDRFGHGGALASNMGFDRRADLVTVMLVQIVGAEGRDAGLWTGFQENATAHYAAG